MDRSNGLLPRPCATTSTCCARPRTAPGPQSTATQVTKRLARIDIELLTAQPMRQLHLIQERHDLKERARWYELEAGFVEMARAYSRRHGISYETWLEMGIPVRVLRRAGLRP